MGLILFIISLVALASEGFVGAKLWDFFLVPLGVPAIGVAHMLGLVFFLAMLMPQRKMTGTTEEKVQKTLERLVGMWVILGVSFLAKLAM